VAQDVVEVCGGGRGDGVEAGACECCGAGAGGPGRPSVGVDVDAGHRVRGEVGGVADEEDGEAVALLVGGERGADGEDSGGGGVGDDEGARLGLVGVLRHAGPFGGGFQGCGGVRGQREPGGVRGLRVGAEELVCEGFGDDESVWGGG
jgi:hypothetical protein